MDNFNTKFILLDGEYGGVRSKGSVSHDYSILELAFTVTDVNLKKIESLNLKIKPDDGKYIVSAEGLAANKINLVTHDKQAVSFGKAKELLYNFIKKNSNDGANKLIPLGKGISGDIRYLFDQKIINEHNWRNFCSDQVIDFGSIIMLLKVLNLYPQTVKKSTGKMSNSLEALAQNLGVDTVALHAAAGDVDLYLKVCEHLFTHLKKNLPAIKF